MIVEKRTYTLHPGATPAFMELYEAEGLALHRKYLPMLGYFTSDIGPQNQIVTLWGYESMAEREAKRAALYADPEWIAFGPRMTPFIQTMENVILKPTSFSPIGN
ncbi:MAG: NIPSNAP family protein [bacterium]|nr:NIPSNAP family protein [Nioella sp.]